MIKRILTVILCSAVIVSAAGCSSSQKSAASASVSDAASASADESSKVSADTPSDATVSQEAAPSEDAKIADPAASDPAASPASAAPADAAVEMPDDELLAEESAAAADPGDYDDQYGFVNVKYDGSERILVYPNGTVNDETVLYNGKTLGGLCDYIDDEVLEEGRTINREFLYDLVAVQLIDPQMVTQYDQFSEVMRYCLTIANEFHSMKVDVKDLILTYDDNTKQTFEVIAEGKEDSWILDEHEKKFYLNGGSTEYVSSMFDAQTMAVWSVVLDQYFGEGN